MKKFTKRMITLAVVSVLLITTVTACGGSSDNSASKDNSGNSSTNIVDTNKSNETTFADISADIRGNEAPTAEQIEQLNSTPNDTYLGDIFDTVIPSDYSAYPFKESVTLDVWMPANSDIPDENAHGIQKMVEKMTGIKVNFITPPLGQEADSFTLMISSGDLPDIIIDPGRYPGGLEAGVNDGAYLDLTDLMEKNAPNYNAWRNSDEMRRKRRLRTMEGC